MTDVRIIVIGSDSTAAVYSHWKKLRATLKWEKGGSMKVEISNNERRQSGELQKSSPAKIL